MSDFCLNVGYAKIVQILLFPKILVTVWKEERLSVWKDGANASLLHFPLKPSPISPKFLTNTKTKKTMKWKWQWRREWSMLYFPLKRSSISPKWDKYKDKGKDNENYNVKITRIPKTMWRGSGERRAYPQGIERCWRYQLCAMKNLATISLRNSIPWV